MMRCSFFHWSISTSLYHSFIRARWLTYCFFCSMFHMWYNVIHSCSQLQLLPRRLWLLNLGLQQQTHREVFVNPNTCAEQCWVLTLCQVFVKYASWCLLCWIFFTVSKLYSNAHFTSCCSFYGKAFYVFWNISNHFYFLFNSHPVAFVSSLLCFLLFLCSCYQHVTKTCEFVSLYACTHRIIFNMQ